MVAAPTSKLFVLELPVLIVKRVGKHRIGEHIFLSNFAYNLHKDLLELDEILNMVNGKLSVRELHTTKQGFQIRAVKDRDIRESALIDSEEWLIQTIDELLELLSGVI